MGLEPPVEKRHAKRGLEGMGHSRGLMQSGVDEPADCEDAAQQNADRTVNYLQRLFSATPVPRGRRDLRPWKPPPAGRPAQRNLIALCFCPLNKTAFPLKVTKMLRCEYLAGFMIFISVKAQQKADNPAKPEQQDGTE